MEEASRALVQSNILDQFQMISGLFSWRIWKVLLNQSPLFYQRSAIFSPQFSLNFLCLYGGCPAQLVGSTVMTNCPAQSDS